MYECQYNIPNDIKNIYYLNKYKKNFVINIKTKINALFIYK